MKEYSFEAHESYVLDLLFSGDGRILASAGMDNLIKLWAMPGGELIRSLEGHEKSVNSISLSSDGRRLASGSTDGTVRLWSFPHGERLHTLQDRKKTVAAVALSQDGRWVAAGSYGGRAAVWTPEGEEVTTIQAGGKNLTSVAISPGGDVLATAGLGGEIGLWSLPEGGGIGTLQGHETAAGSLAFIGGGRHLLSLGYEQTVRAWDVEGREEERVIPLDEEARGLVVSPDEARVALALEGRVEVRRLKGWELERELEVGTKSVGGMAFSPDGLWLAVGAADRVVRLWEVL
jgi:WD40 repeat protein